MQSSLGHVIIGKDLRPAFFQNVLRFWWFWWTGVNSLVNHDEYNIATLELCSPITCARRDLSRGNTAAPQKWMMMEADKAESWFPLSENGTTSLNASNLGFLNINASSPVGLWGDAKDKEVARLEKILQEQERAYKDFTTTIQVFILIGSLLSK